MGESSQIISWRLAVLCALIVGGAALLVHRVNTQSPWRAVLELSEPAALGRVIVAGAPWCVQGFQPTDEKFTSAAFTEVAQQYQTYFIDADAHRLLFQYFHERANFAARVCSYALLLDEGGNLVSSHVAGADEAWAAWRDALEQPRSPMQKSPKPVAGDGSALSDFDRLDAILQYAEQAVAAPRTVVTRPLFARWWLLLDVAERMQSPTIRGVVTEEVRALVSSGAFDAVDGGVWSSYGEPRVKHLAINAEFLRLALALYQQTQILEFRAIALYTAEYLHRVMYDAERAAFIHAEATPAHFHPESRAVIESRLSPEEWRVVSLMLAWDDPATPETWVRRRSLEEVAYRLRWPVSRVADVYDAARRRLATVRREHVVFRRDARIFGAAQGRAIRALIHADRVLKLDRYREAGINALASWRVGVRRGVLRHRGDQSSSTRQYLEDQFFLYDALHALSRDAPKTQWSNMMRAMRTEVLPLYVRGDRAWLRQPPLGSRFHPDYGFWDHQLPALLPEVWMEAIDNTQEETYSYLRSRAESVWQVSELNQSLLSVARAWYAAYYADERLP